MYQVESLADAAHGSFALVASDGLYAQRYTQTETPLWSTRVLTAHDNQSWSPMANILSDNGNLFLGYQSMQRFFFEGVPLYWRHGRVQKIDTTGTALWATDGIWIHPTDTDTTTEYIHTLVPDGAGGVYVWWQETGFLSAPKTTIRQPAAYDSLGEWMQHLDASGTRLWPGRGRIMQQMDSLGFNLFAMSGDDAGGFISWETVVTPGGGYALQSNHYLAPDDTVISHLLPYAPTYHKFILVDHDLVLFQHNSEDSTWSVTRYASDGTAQYTHPLDFPGVTQLHEIQKDQDGNVFVSANQGAGELLLAKIDATGQLVWKKTVAGVWQIVPDEQGGLFYTQFERSGTHGDAFDEGYVMRLNIAGESAWVEPVLFTNIDRFSHPDYPKISFSADKFGGLYIYWVANRLGEFGTLEAAVYRAFINQEGELGIPTGVKNEIVKNPVTFQLYPAYPNPFNPNTTLTYQLPQAGRVQLIICNATGQQVATLVDRQQVAGEYKLQFNGTNYASGIYFVRLTVDGKSIQSQKILLLK